MCKHLEPNKILRFLVPVWGGGNAGGLGREHCCARVNCLAGHPGVMFANMIMHVHKKNRHVHEHQREPFFMFVNMAVFNRKPRKFYVREHDWPT